MAESTKFRILGFNGLRALCVIAVFLSHKCNLEFYAAPLGVWTFLVISGFLIIGELHGARLDVEAARYGVGTALRIFATKRALRIFPAYYGLLALLFLVRRLYDPMGNGLDFVWHAVYLSNYFSAFVSPNLGSPFGVLWTLSVEQQFYVLAPIAFVLCPAVWHARICICVVIVAAAGHLLMQHHGVSARNIYLTSPWNFALIALGGAAGILMRAERYRAPLRRTLPLLIAVTVIATYSASWLAARVPDPIGGMSTFTVSIALALLVAWIRCNQESLAVRLLEWPPLEYLGVISYGFYLIHNFIPSRSIPGYIGLANYPILGWFIGALISFAISVALAHISWRFYERPILGLRARLLPKRVELPKVKIGAAGSPT
ncbi:acyltransferase family protein [Methylobacterium sp. A49B]